ncbi:MAG TPA: hypothetical protein PK735_12970 [Flavobacteriales bacterium]|nr:hypothetical protein [Flavobacteriales bacterium]
MIIKKQIFRVSMIFIMLMYAARTNAQAVHRKHLLTSFGAGIGQLHIATGGDTSGYAARNATCAAVRFAFAYALTDHWSLGFHYDRLGTEGLTVITDKVRFTTYQLEAIWRPWIGENSSIETHAAFGVGLMALTPRRSNLPLRSDSGVLTFGGRYLLMFSNVIGSYVTLEHTVSGDGDLMENDKVMIGTDLDPIQLNWNAQRVSAGMIVRF